MYYSEPTLFFESLKNYVESEPQNHLLIIAPYIQTEVLKKLISFVPQTVKISIITTWKINDILKGSSDLSLYSFCKEYKCSLYLNQRIHLKVLCADFKTCIFGSANFTGKGLSLRDNYNYELFSEPTPLSSEIYLYFNKILYESVLVTEKIYNWYCSATQNKSSPKESLETCPDELLSEESDYLISSLPMSLSPERLYEIYYNNFVDDNEEELECAIHDIVLYNIPSKLSKEDFILHLKDTFFKKPFILSLISYLGEGKYFGELKVWIQDNCTDVPVPSRRDLTGNLQVLYSWIVDLSDGKYQIEVPGRHSQRLSLV